MKKTKLLGLISSVSIAGFICMPLSACNKNVAIEEINFNQEGSWVEIGNSRDFSQEVNIVPANASNKNLTWKIVEPENNSQIATVDENTGVVTGLSSGWVKLVCTSKDGSGKTAEQWIVVDKYIELTDFKIPAEMSLDIGNTVKIEKFYAPKTATSAIVGDVLWKSLNETVATVDEFGNITGVAAGTAIITATPYDYDNASKEIKPKDSLRSICIVTVKEAVVESIAVLPEKITVGLDKVFRLEHKCYPLYASQECDIETPAGGEITYNAATGKFTVSSSATVDKDYTITFKSKTTPTVTGECIVTIKTTVDPMITLTFEDGTKIKTKTIAPGDSGLLPTVKTDPINMPVIWWSSDPNYVTVDQKNGNFLTSENAEGQHVHLVCADPLDPDNADKHAYVYLTIDKPTPTDIEVLYCPPRLFVGQKRTIKYHVLPAEAKQDVKFATIGASGAFEVSDEGEITAIKPGKGQIKITCKNNPNIYKYLDFEVLDYVPFANDSWTNIAQYASEGIESLHKHYAIDCDQNKDFPHTLIGLERKVQINNQEHRVKVIAENQDQTPDGKRLCLTFQTMTALSNASGNAIQSVWQSPANNTDYTNSQLRKNLTGEGTGTQTFGQTVLSMLPEDLLAVIKPVSKRVYVPKDDSIHKYGDKIFTMSALEVGGSFGEISKEEGSMYTYWQKFRTEEYKTIKSANGGITQYWLRTASKESKVWACLISEWGGSAITGTQFQNGVVFGFCI